MKMCALPPSSSSRLAAVLHYRLPSASTETVTGVLTSTRVRRTCARGGSAAPILQLVNVYRRKVWVEHLFGRAPSCPLVPLCRTRIFGARLAIWRSCWVAVVWQHDQHMLDAHVHDSCLPLTGCKMVLQARPNPACHHRGGHYKCHRCCWSRGGRRPGSVRNTAKQAQSVLAAHASTGNRSFTVRVNVDHAAAEVT